MISKPGLYDLSEAEYHSDPCDVPSLSASIATTLVTRSPLHAWLSHPRLGGRARAATPAMERGTLVHALVLGTTANIEKIEADSFRTTAAKEARDDARAAGRIPVLAADYEEIEVMAEGIRANLTSLGIALDGASEKAAVWHEESQFGPVLCRGRLDHLWLERGQIADLKTCQNAHPIECGKHMINYGCDVQWAAYTSALRALRPDLAGREEMVFLFAEVEHPYCVTPGLPDGGMRMHGESRWRRAVEMWAQCLHEDRWPAYTDGVVEIAAPGWALMREDNAA